MRSSRSGDCGQRLVLVEGGRVVPPRDKPAAPASPRTRRPPRRRGFRSSRCPSPISGDPAQDYLVDALTDELTTSLARLRDTLRDRCITRPSTSRASRSTPRPSARISASATLWKARCSRAPIECGLTLSSSTPAAALISGPSNSTRRAPICCRRKTRSSPVCAHAWTFNSLGRGCPLSNGRPRPNPDVEDWLSNAPPARVEGRISSGRKRMRLSHSASRRSPSIPVMSAP